MHRRWHTRTTDGAGTTDILNQFNADRTASMETGEATALLEETGETTALLKDPGEDHLEDLNEDLNEDPGEDRGKDHLEDLDDRHKARGLVKDPVRYRALMPRRSRDRPSTAWSCR